MDIIIHSWDMLRGIACAKQALTGGTAPARNPLLGGSASNADAFQLPPLVLEAVGPKPQSFPLTLLHAGRCSLNISSA